MDNDEALPHREREVTLSTGAILGIFFGLAALCGAFFAFGYNMGHKAVPTPLVLSESAGEATPGSAASAAGKPSPGSPMEGAGTPANATTLPGSVPEAATAATVKVEPPKPKPPKPAEASPEAAAADEAESKPAPVVRRPAAEAEAAPAKAAGAAAPVLGGAGTSFMVQVAAVSHQEDADLLVGALKSRGYAVTARPGANDAFIHVQVGPFRDKQAAEAMRQRLLGDGYNAIVKF